MIRLLCSLSDGSHPSSTQEHGSEPSVPPVLPLLQHHCLGQPLAVSASSCCLTSSAPRSPSSEGSLTVCPSFLPGFSTSVTKSEVREDKVGLTATGGIYFVPQQPTLNITQCKSNISLGLSGAHDLLTSTSQQSVPLLLLLVPSPFMRSLHANYWNKTQVFVICTGPTYSHLSPNSLSRCRPR